MADKSGTDEFLGNLGLERLSKRNSTLKNVIKNPGAYYDERQAEINKVGEEVKDFYKTAFNKARNVDKFGKEESKKRATNYATAIYDLRMREIDVDFPEDLRKFDISTTTKDTFAHGIPNSGRKEKD